MSEPFKNVMLLGYEMYIALLALLILINKIAISKITNILILAYMYIGTLILAINL